MSITLGLTPQQYIELERAAEFRSEFCDGAMFLKSGSSWAHNVLVCNLTGMLHRPLLDRGRKFEQYRAIPTLAQYVLISQDRVNVEVFTRQANDAWLMTEASELSVVVELPSIKCSIPLAELYEGVDFTRLQI